MRIGIDGSRAFIENRTGIEEYSYQVIKKLTEELKSQQVVLFVRGNQLVDFNLPKNWKIKIIRFPRFWTQLGLSLEMLLHPVETLFVPAHTVPVIHPKNTVVVIHGLEYEFCPESYSLWDRIYMRCSIKNSCTWAKTIISVSENTKKDLMSLYGVSEEKIKVIYEGYDDNFKFQISNLRLNTEDKISEILRSQYLLFVGRIEERKNISNILAAFEILKEKYKVTHRLVLAGKPGYGYDNLKFKIKNFKFSEDITELGFVSEQEKWALLKKADVFIFPTLYEGFGIPILEAQSMGCPVVASSNSSIPEVTGGSAILVDPQDPADIAAGIYDIISNEALKNAIIAKGLENVKKFSWGQCAKSISEILVKKN